MPGEHGAIEKSGSSPRNSNSEAAGKFVEHIRAVHFALVAVCVGLLVTIIGKNNEASKAAEEFGHIREIVKKLSQTSLSDIALEEARKCSPKLSLDSSPRTTTFFTIWTNGGLYGEPIVLEITATLSPITFSSNLLTRLDWAKSMPSLTEFEDVWESLGTSTHVYGASETYSSNCHITGAVLPFGSNHEKTDFDTISRAWVVASGTKQYDDYPSAYAYQGAKGDYIPGGLRGEPSFYHAISPNRRFVALSSLHVRNDKTEPESALSIWDVTKESITQVTLHDPMVFQKKYYFGGCTTMGKLAINSRGTLLAYDLGEENNGSPGVALIRLSNGQTNDLRGAQILAASPVYFIGDTDSLMLTGTYRLLGDYNHTGFRIYTGEGNQLAEQYLNGFACFPISAEADSVVVAATPQYGDSEIVRVNLQSGETNVLAILPKGTLRKQSVSENGELFLDASFNDGRWLLEPWLRQKDSYSKAIKNANDLVRLFNNEGGLYSLDCSHDGTQLLAVCSNNVFIANPADLTFKPAFSRSVFRRQDVHFVGEQNNLFCFSNWDIHVLEPFRSEFEIEPNKGGSLALSLSNASGGWEFQGHIKLPFHEVTQINVNLQEQLLLDSHTQHRSTNGGFREAFPDVAVIAGNAPELTLADLEKRITERQVSERNEAVDFIGIHVPTTHLTMLGMMFICSIQLYLSRHLRFMMAKHLSGVRESKSAWIGLYNDSVSQVATLITIVVIPFIACVGLFFQAFRVYELVWLKILLFFFPVVSIWLSVCCSRLLVRTWTKLYRHVALRRRRYYLR